MRILAIDTTSKNLCLAISDGSKSASLTLDCERRHAALLVPFIKKSVSALDISLKDIDYFAVGLGPGSFTGIRIGLSTIKGLAWSLNKPVVGFSTLDAIARNVLDALKDNCFSAEVAVIVDAKRGQGYFCSYRLKDKRLKRTSRYKLLNLEDILALLPKDCIVLGDGVGVFQNSLLRAKSKPEILDKDFWYPRGHNLIPLAEELVSLGKISSAFKVKPIYLYPQDCQLKGH